MENPIKKDLGVHLFRGNSTFSLPLKNSGLPGASRRLARCRDEHWPHICGGGGLWRRWRLWMIFWPGASCWKKWKVLENQMNYDDLMFKPLAMIFHCLSLQSLFPGLHWVLVGFKKIAIWDRKTRKQLLVHQRLKYVAVEILNLSPPTYVYTPVYGQYADLFTCVWCRENVNQGNKRS